MQRALAAALKDAPLLPRDAAGVALAKRYARHLDEAQALADAVDLLEPESEDMAKRVQQLKLKLDAVAVASDLGPKLEKVLTSLGMTLAGRGAKTVKEEPRGPVPGADELAALRAQRAGQHGA